MSNPYTKSSHVASRSVTCTTHASCPSTFADRTSARKQLVSERNAPNLPCGGPRKLVPTYLNRVGQWRHATSCLAPSTRVQRYIVGGTENGHRLLAVHGEHDNLGRLGKAIQQHVFEFEPAGARYAVDFAINQPDRTPPVDHSQVAGIPEPAVALSIVPLLFANVGQRPSRLRHLNQTDLSRTDFFPRHRIDSAKLAQKRDRPSENLGNRRSLADVAHRSA